MLVFLKGYASLRLVKGHNSCKLQHCELLESCERFEFQYLRLLEKWHMANFGYLVMQTDCGTNPPKRGAASTVQNKSIKGVKKLRVLIFVFLMGRALPRPPPTPPLSGNASAMQKQSIHGCSKPFSDPCPLQMEGAANRPSHPQPFRNVSTMQKQRITGCRKLRCSDLCPCFANRGFTPKPPAIS